jgi:Cytochrome oxidase c assembly
VSKIANEVHKRGRKMARACAKRNHPPLGAASSSKEQKIEFPPSTTPNANNPVTTFSLIPISIVASSKMPKSAIDATRFTSTTPHASAKPPTTSPSLNSSSSTLKRAPGPLGETPQQKVRRLREAAARARDAKISTFDKFVIRGRVWADRAHRFTALTLIGLTGTFEFPLPSNSSHVIPNSPSTSKEPS